MRLVDIESESFLNEMREMQNACKEMIQRSDGEIPTWTERDHWEGVYGIFVEMALTLKKQPTVDAAPVVHARWAGDETCEAYDICGVKTWAVKRRCSACGFTHKFIEAHMYYDFCPKCSANMDLEGLDAN